MAKRTNKTTIESQQNDNQNIFQNTSFLLKVKYELIGEEIKKKYLQYLQNGSRDLLNEILEELDTLDEAKMVTLQKNNFDIMRNIQKDTPADTNLDKLVSEWRSQ